MKIGILTFQNTTNYGAVLQGFALETKIKELGAECEIINYHCKNVELRENFVFPKYESNLITYLKKIKGYILSIKKIRKIKKFIRENMILSRKEYNKNTINSSNEIYDKFVVGSDMVFNLDITDGDLTYYLDFADNEKRYSYAASIGDKINDKYLQNCQNNLNKFQHLSVRENQTKEYFENLINNKIYVDCDPTLLHNSEFWIKYEENPKYKPSKKYILLYFLDNKGIILDAAQKLAKENNLEIVVLGRKPKRSKIENCKFISNASVGEFLYYIHNSELVITGSYHGMIFSINYNTNFMYFNRAHSSRMENVAKLTNSTDRRLTEDYIPKIKCDFEEINKSIEKIRENSISYLKNLVKD